MTSRKDVQTIHDRIVRAVVQAGHPDWSLKEMIETLRHIAVDARQLERELFALNEAGENLHAKMRELSASRSAVLEEAAKACEDLRDEWLKGNAQHSISDFKACAAVIRALKEQSAAQEAKVKDATSVEASAGAAPLGASPLASAGPNDADTQVVAVPASQVSQTASGRAALAEPAESVSPCVSGPVEVMLLNAISRIHDSARMFRHTDRWSQEEVEPGKNYWEWIEEGIYALAALAAAPKVDAHEEIRDLKAALQEARGDTYPQPKRGWQCFHCGEWFTTEASARSHFGETPESHKSVKVDAPAAPPSTVGAPVELGWQCPSCKRCYCPGKWQCDYCKPSLKDRVRSN